ADFTGEPIPAVVGRHVAGVGGAGRLHVAVQVVDQVLDAVLGVAVVVRLIGGGEQRTGVAGLGADVVDRHAIDVGELIVKRLAVTAGGRDGGGGPAVGDGITQRPNDDGGGGGGGCFYDNRTD